MTQEEFFGAIEHNLLQLAKRHCKLSSCDIPMLETVSGKADGMKWRMRVKALHCISKDDASCPRNIRCYDLRSARASVAGGDFFRVFACYVEDPTRGGYREAKFAIRKWYQESGWAASSAKPYAAAMVIGAASPWEPDMTPNADDMPCGNVAFRMLAAPRPQPGQGLLIIREGDVDSCDIVFHALVPETFDKVEKRVRDFVNGQFLPDGKVVGGGYVTVRRVRDTLPMLPVDVVVRIFNKMQAEGTHRIGKIPRSPHLESMESRVYIENKPPSWWNKMRSSGEGEWYAQSRFCKLVAVGSIVSLLTLPFAFIKNISPEVLFTHKWLVLAVCCGMLCLWLVLWLLGAMRRRV